MIQIPFSLNWKNVAISLSGGADSALLAYLICDQARKNNLEPFTLHCISHIRMWKTKPWQGWDSQNIFQRLEVEFPYINFVRHTNFIPPEMEWGDKGPSMIDEYGKLVSGDNIELRAFGEYVCYNNSVDAYFNAVTRNPKNVDFKGMPTRDIDPTDANHHLVEMEHMGMMAYHPFRFLEKSKIIADYKELDIEWLLDLTRSCEGEIGGIDYTTYTPGQDVPVCGECFWCKERAWAINENNKS
jgi:7-cyano-7-deazaguanine synthase in queuosine biosynthesis